MNEPIHQKIITANIPWEQNHLEVPVYLIKGGFNVLIDAGPPQRDPGVLSSAFSLFGVPTSDIGFLLLTHGHLDHVGGIPELTAAGRPQVFIHRDDAFFLSHHDKAFDEFYGLGGKLLSGKDRTAEEKAGFLAAMGPETVPDKLLRRWRRHRRGRQRGTAGRGSSRPFERLGGLLLGEGGNPHRRRLYSCSRRSRRLPADHRGPRRIRKIHRQALSNGPGHPRLYPSVPWGPPAARNSEERR